MLSDAMTWLLGVLQRHPAHMPEPWVIALGLAALTLLLEDAAIAAGILLAGDGTVGWPLAFVAVAGGIAGGDLLLYLLGATARRLPPARRWLFDTCRAEKARRLLDKNTTTAVLIARVVPGLRLAVYTAFGLFALPFVPFALLVSVAVAVWTGALFWLGSAGTAIAQHWGAPVWPAAVALFVLLNLAPILARRLAAATRRYRR
jgi:membrane protein DedA with SNARE-associated domain